MNRTFLYDVHVALGGRMVDFAGWELPVQYPTGPLEEHKRVREAAGLFDIDHMGQVVVADQTRSASCRKSRSTTSARWRSTMLATA
ncbi:hypothetical protein [Candidatus Amarolinea dominans]|uniref:hypothetical protein n=1 Tax=Candidatus Amarolinea dominans TaxID=3140696 RepID=UPI0031CCD683